MGLMLYRSHTVNALGAAGLNITLTVPSGVANNDFLILTLSSDGSGFATATFGSTLDGWTERTTPSGVQSANVSLRLWTRVASSEPADYAITSSTILNTGRIVAFNSEGGTPQFDDGADWSFDDAGTETVSTTDAVDVGSGGFLYCEFVNDSVRTVSSAPSGMTLISTNDSSASLTTSAYYQQTSGTGITKSLTWSSGEQFIAIAASFSAPGTSPTIDTQPTAQTARLNGDTTRTATFTVAATASAGSLTYDWELETSVGGGSYSNLADGSGATWTGQTAASAVGTFTAKTLSGRRVRCNVTDSNGTTTTDAVTLTVLDGPVLSASTDTTDGSGIASVTMTSDDALSANGEILLVTATVRGQVIARTTVRPA